MIYVTSDWHFNHSKDFIYKSRGFTSVEEMNEAIIKRHNSLVDFNDDVYVLGDLCLGGCEPGITISNQNLIERMNGRLHVVCGNHCTPKKIEMYKTCKNIVEVEWAIMLPYKKYHFLMTHFPCMTGNLEKESLKQMTLNLYGHTHQKTNFYEDRPYMYHVGCDSHYCYPVLLDDIIQEMKDKVKECIDYLDCAAAAPTENKPSLNENAPAAILRCDKCVYSNYFCGYTDYNGDCPMYKRDPPDGGFYG